MSQTGQNRQTDGTDNSAVAWGESFYEPLPKNERHMWWYESHPPDLISVLTQIGIAANGLVSLLKCTRWITTVATTAKMHMQMRNTKYITATCTATQVHKLIVDLIFCVRCVMNLLYTLASSQSVKIVHSVNLLLFSELRSTATWRSIDRTSAYIAECVQIIQNNIKSHMRQVQRN